MVVAEPTVAKRLQIEFWSADKQIDFFAIGILVQSTQIWLLLDQIALPFTLFTNHIFPEPDKFPGNYTEELVLPPAHNPGQGQNGNDHDHDKNNHQRYFLPTTMCHLISHPIPMKQSSFFPSVGGKNCVGEIFDHGSNDMIHVTL